MKSEKRKIHIQYLSYQFTFKSSFWHRFHLSTAESQCVIHLIYSNKCCFIFLIFHENSIQFVFFSLLHPSSFSAVLYYINMFLWIINTKTNEVIWIQNWNIIWHWLEQKKDNLSHAFLYYSIFKATKCQSKRSTWTICFIDCKIWIQSVCNIKWWNA